LPLTPPSNAPSADTVPAPSVAPPESAVPPSILAADIERVSLEQAIERALRRNPTASIAALEIERADALTRQARASSFPQLTGNATLTHLDSDRVSTTGGNTRVIAAQNQFGANLVLQVPLFAPSRWAAASHARDNERLSAESTAETRRQLVIAVAKSYLAVVAQHRVIEVAESAVLIARSQNDYAKTRLSGGIGKRLDAVRSAQLLASNLAALERSKMGLVRAMEALGVLLGEDRPIDIAVEPLLDAPRGNALDRNAVVNRKDVAVAKRRLDNLTRVAHDSWLDYLPLLVGQFQPFYQTPPTLTQPETGWQAQLLLSVPLYDGGARSGAAAERRILKEQAEQQLQALLRQSRSEVRVAFEGVRNAERALEAAQTAATLAKDAETMAILAYEAGASTNLEVVDAQRRTRDANTDVLVAEDALRQSKLDLLIAAGQFPKG
jgi:outer membrane protein TolC